MIGLEMVLVGNPVVGGPLNYCVYTGPAVFVSFVLLVIGE